MSLDAIAAMQDQFNNVIDDSPFSQGFILDPDGSAVAFNGIFDDPYQTEGEDGGHVKARTSEITIQVKEIIDAMKARETVVSNVADTLRWKISRAGKDTNGVPLIWLY